MRASNITQSRHSPRKRESRAVSAPLALGARFRGHDENIATTYVNFCNEVLALISNKFARLQWEAWFSTGSGFCREDGVFLAGNEKP